MSVGFERAGLATPKYAHEGLGVLSPDEDAFTLAVGAIEALNDPVDEPPVAAIHLLGPIPATLDWGLPAYLGVSAPITRHSENADGVRSALRSATDVPDDAASLVVMLDMSGPGGPTALALRFGPHAATVQPNWDALAPGATPARAVGALLGPQPPGPSTRPEPLWPDEASKAVSEVLPNQVSEGAYVPRPRYLENLPSRWRLDADRCGRCGRITFPRRARCRSCGTDTPLSPTRLPRDGARVVARTRIGKGGQPTEFDPQVAALGGYAVVLAEFAPGVRLTLQVTDAAPDELRIGNRIGTRLRRLYPMEGEWRYGRKAVPLVG